MPVLLFSLEWGGHTCLKKKPLPVKELLFSGEESLHEGLGWLSRLMRAAPRETCRLLRPG
jgi:hypothetical protein